MPRGSWANAPEYQFRSDNPNPKFRPKVDRLVSQLRTHSSLVGHPEAVEFVIDDLLHYHFLRENKQPARLWRLMLLTKSYWERALGIRMEGEQDQQMDIFSRAMMERRGVGTGGNEDAILWAHEVTPVTEPDQAWEEDQERRADGDVLERGETLTITRFPDPEIPVKRSAVVRELEMDADQYLRIWEAGYKAGRDGEMKQWAQAPDGGSRDVSRDVSRDEVVAAEPFDLADKRLKVGVEGVVAEHFPIKKENAYHVYCTCKREYRSITEWSQHVRKRLWNYIKNEFPVIGSEEE